MSTRAADYWQLTKPGITRHVMLAAAAGHWLGSRGEPDVFSFVALLVGTALVSGGTNGLNQWWERDVDARMSRTASRPLASGRLPAPAGLAFSLGIGLAGCALLWWRVNFLTAALAALTLGSYVLVYTPLKKRTTLNTLAGCLPGALPILGGWTAATGRVEPGALALFAILYCWQLPHMLALAWMYRDDYAAGGLIMPGHDDETGRRTAAKAIGYTAMLAAASLSLTPLGVTHEGYSLAALSAAMLLLIPTVRWALAPSRRLARLTFLGTVLYLPALLAAMVLGRA